MYPDMVRAVLQNTGQDAVVVAPDVDEALLVAERRGVVAEGRDEESVRSSSTARTGSVPACCRSVSRSRADESMARTAAPARKVDYRILATARTSMLQKDLTEAAGEGFRIIGAGLGYMTVVLAPEHDSIGEARETHLVAAIRPSTALKELQSAARMVYSTEAVARRNRGSPSRSAAH